MDFWCKVAWRFAEARNLKQRKESVPLIAIDISMVQVIGHRHEIFLIWAAASEEDLFNTNGMDVSTCSPFSCNWYAAFRSPLTSFEEECPTGKSADMLLRKTPAEHSPSPGYEYWLKKLIKSNRSRHSEKHVGGNANKKLLKEINATNTGEITNASSHSVTGWLLAL